MIHMATSVVCLCVIIVATTALSSGQASPIGPHSVSVTRPLFQSSSSSTSTSPILPWMALNQLRRRYGDHHPLGHLPSHHSGSGVSSYYHHHPKTTPTSSSNVSNNRLSAFLSHSRMPSCKELKMMWFAGQLVSNPESRELYELLRILLDESPSSPNAPISTSINKAISASLSKNVDENQQLQQTIDQNAMINNEPLVYIADRVPASGESLPALSDRDLFAPRLLTLEQQSRQPSINSSHNSANNSSINTESVGLIGMVEPSDENTGDNSESFGRVVFLDRNGNPRAHFGAFLDNRLQVRPEIAEQKPKIAKTEVTLSSGRNGAKFLSPNSHSHSSSSNSYSSFSPSSSSPSSAGIVGRRVGERVGRLQAFSSSPIGSGGGGGGSGQNSRRRDDLTMSGFWHSKLSKPTVNLVSGRG